ncbi:MAG: alpha/beta fold hydrolase [Chloroflexi bacterium]|nr:alpha/beta fold hydrolase [Chloroflexota bacterium]
MRLPVNGFMMNYNDIGKGHPIVLIHAFPLDGTMWEPQEADLQRDYRVIIPDLRSFGASEVTEGLQSMDLLADDVSALLDLLDIHQATLVGCSMGGYIAFAFYRRHADRLRGLGLVSTRAGGDNAEARQNRLDLARTVHHDGQQIVVDRLLPRLLAPGGLEERTDLAQKLEQMMRRASIAGIAGASTGMADRPDSTSLLPAIKQPTLVVAGEQDQIIPVAEARKMAELIPTSKLQVVPGAGHMVNLEQPQVFNHTLRNFLVDLGL